jgi:hypothetical protein
VSSPYPMAYPGIDPIATPLAGALLGALIDAYDDPAWQLEPPCSAGLVSGSALIADYCCSDSSADGTPCEGQLTVRVVNVFPTETFPSPRSTAIPACGSPWAVELEVAVLRCALSIDTDAVPPILPSMEDEMGVAERALADAGLLRHVLTDYAVSQDMAFTFGPYQPMGPDGGCVGGAVTATYLIV